MRYQQRTDELDGLIIDLAALTQRRRILHELSRHRSHELEHMLANAYRSERAAIVADMPGDCAFEPAMNGAH